MKPKPDTEPDKLVRDIKRATRRKFSAEEKIRIVLAGLHGEDSIAEMRRLSDDERSGCDWHAEGCIVGGRFSQKTMSQTAE